ncbi:hypothetical protein QTA57_08200 [Fontisubflavum oceani]|uniref:hypothetical protein n=1 Tax=Fontisubflavum oceani TaxID=2978973 RepID=UPI0025B6167C|nr:hypothetical protein [Fontisubflavum oceani]WJY23043.1 hypothetical protein QTA57_08200 [Fontisubflavum oceani]
MQVVEEPALASQSAYVSKEEPASKLTRLFESQQKHPFLWNTFFYSSGLEGIEFDPANLNPKDFQPGSNIRTRIENAQSTAPQRENLSDLIDLVEQDENIADIVAEACCLAPSLGDIEHAKSAAPVGYTKSGEPVWRAKTGDPVADFFEKLAELEFEARDSDLDQSVVHKVINRLLDEATALMDIDQDEVDDIFEDALESEAKLRKLSDWFNAYFSAKQANEKQPAKAKGDRSKISQAMDILATGLSSEITELELSNATNKLAARSDFDSIAKVNWVALIVENTPLRRVEAKKIVKESVALASQQDDNAGCYVGQSDHNEQCSYVIKKLVKGNQKCARPDLMRYGFQLGYVRHLPEEGQTEAQLYSVDAFASLINKLAPFYKIEEKSSRIVPAPSAVVRDVMNTEMPKLPYLRQVTNYVQFDSELNLLAKNTYHKSAYLYMHLPEDFDLPAISDTPTDAEVKQAVSILVEEWLGDWPFDGYTRDEILVSCGIQEPAEGKKVRPVPPSLLSFIGFVLQPLVRPAIKGPVPGLLITKPEAGTGASLLTDTAIVAIHGKTSTRTMPKDEDERRKEVFTALRAGDPFLFFDNVAGQVDSPVLAALLTSTNFTGRILGLSEEATIPNQTSPVITGNNPRFTRELQRRLSLCRLDAGVAKPEDREPEGGWRHADIEEWVLANRGQIVWALCTLVLNWKAKGCPKPAGKPLGSYRSWYEVCGGVLGAASLHGWQSNRKLIEQVAGADDDDPMRELVSQWYDVATTKGGALSMTGEMAKQLAAFADARDIDMPVARHVVDGERLYKPSAFGQYLGTQAERVFEVDGINVKVEAGTKTKHGKPWQLSIV